jgi:hypothetical protein
MPFSCHAKRGIEMKTCGRRAAWKFRELHLCTRCAADLSINMEPGNQLRYLRGMGLGGRLECSSAP